MRLEVKGDMARSGQEARASVRHIEGSDDQVSDSNEVQCGRSRVAGCGKYKQNCRLSEEEAVTAGHRVVDLL